MKAKRSTTLTPIFLMALLPACSQVKTPLNVQQPAAQALALTTFQGQPKTHWIVDPNGDALTNSRTLSFTGLCPTGVAQVVVLNAGQAVGNPATCAANQTFTWQSVMPADGNYALSFHANTTTGADITQAVSIDTTPLPAPIITTNSDMNFISSSPRVIIDGTVTTRAFTMNSTNGGTLEFAAESGVFEYTIELTAGQTITLSFSASDAVGNTSPATSITVSYSPSVTLTAVAPVAAYQDSAVYTAQTGLRLQHFSIAPTTASLRASQQGTGSAWTGILGFVAE